MNILILDKEFKTIYILDHYESLIWTDRYYEAGDFEIYAPLDYALLDYLQIGYYLQISESEHTMIIEKTEITTDVETGRHLIITGRSLESILDRRIIYPKYEIKGTPKLYNEINKWLNNHVYSSSYSSYGTGYKNRKIDNFDYKGRVTTDTYTDSRVTDIKTSYASYEGSNLYNSIVTLCKSNKLGFKITLTTDNKFYFQLYMGDDRGYEQTDYKTVVFSEYFDNLYSTDYIYDEKTHKTTLVLTNGGTSSTTVKHYGKDKAGLDRKEYYSSISGTSDTDIDWKWEAEKVYIANCPTHKITGEIDTKNEQFKYGRDYFLGDLVSIENAFVDGNGRITEYTINITESGKESHPTLEFEPFIEIDEV